MKTKQQTLNTMNDVERTYQDWQRNEFILKLELRRRYYIDNRFIGFLEEFNRYEHTL